MGSRALELSAVKDALLSVPVLAMLEASIYKSRLIYLIPLSKKDQADEIAREIFLNYISKYAPFGCNEQNIVDWSYSGAPGGASNKTLIYDIENPWNTWRVHVIVEGRHGDHNEKYNNYLPPHVVAYHELMHLEETPLKARDLPSKNGDELLTTVRTFILLDLIYKKIHGLDEACEVDYGKSIEINGQKLGLGKFANFYRGLEKEHGKLYLALISEASIKFLTGQC